MRIEFIKKIEDKKYESRSFEIEKIQELQDEYLITLKSIDNLPDNQHYTRISKEDYYLVSELKFIEHCKERK